MRPDRGCGPEPVWLCGLKPVRRCGLALQLHFGLQPVRGCQPPLARRCGPEPEWRCGLGPALRSARRAEICRQLGMRRLRQAQQLLAQREVLRGAAARRCGLELSRGCWLRPARHSATAGAAQRAVTGACPAGYGRLRQAAAGAARLLAGLLGRGGGGGRCGLVCTVKSCGNCEDVYKLGCLLEFCSFFSVAAAARRKI